MEQVSAPLPSGMKIKELTISGLTLLSRLNWLLVVSRVPSSRKLSTLNSTTGGRQEKSHTSSMMLWSSERYVKFHTNLRGH
jgi:hypothetical protein